MIEKVQKLTIVLKQREEQLWQLQNSALQLPSEGPSKALCDLISDGLDELRTLLADSAPTGLAELLQELVSLLKAGKIDRTQGATVFMLIEALVSIERGEGDAALTALLDTAGTAAASAATAQAHQAELVDRQEGIDPEDVRMFAVEAREHLQAIEVNLVELEASEDLALVGEVFRAVHSIKGGAQYLGLEATSALAHRTETLLDRLRKRSIRLSPRVITALLRSRDGLSTLASALEGGTVPEFRVQPLVAELDALIAGSDGEASTPDVGGEKGSDSDAHSARAERATSPVETPQPGRPRATPASPADQPPALADASDVELFAAEYLDNMTSARQLLRDMQALVEDPDKVSIVSRNLHSLKGLAGLVGITEIERIAGALDALVNKVFRHRRELPPDVQRAVSTSLDVMDEVFRQQQSEGRVRTNVDDQLLVIEEFAAREGRLAGWEDVDRWESLFPEEGSGALAASLKGVVEAVRRRQGEGVDEALQRLADAASLQGCDELSDAAAALKRDRSQLTEAQMRDRMVGLRDLLPVDLLSWRESAEDKPPMSFEEAVLSIPGLGRKKLKRLIAAGIDSAAAVQDTGIQGLIAIPGINLEQAKMLAANCAAAQGGERVPGGTRREPGRTLEDLVLRDHYDRDLVTIYLATTIRQIDVTRQRIRDGELNEACALLGDLAGAARYMGYKVLVDSFLAARAALESESPNAPKSIAVLSPVRVAVERLRQRVARLQEGTPGVTPSSEEVGELERIFSESAEGHLTRVKYDLPSFLVQMDESLLSSLQHHLSCLHSAATNIGRDVVVSHAERLQELVEQIWLDPSALTRDLAEETVTLLNGLYKGCGLTPPGLEVPAVAAQSQGVAGRSGAGPEDEVDSVFAEMLVDTPATSAPTPSPGTAVGQTNLGHSGAERAETAASTGPPAVESPRRTEVTVRSDTESLEAGVGLAGGELAGEAGSGGGAEVGRPLVETQATVRVDTAKIDDLMNMVAELVVNRSAFMVLGTTITDLVSKLIESGQLGKVEARDLRMILTRHDEAMTELGRVSNQLQQGVMRIRMMPVRTLFSRAPRLVRDLAVRENRQVRVTFSGEDTELDKTVIERLADPLVHLIRNAISHGIEPPEERVAAGKNPEGHLLISARHQGNIVIIEVEDDGRGIDFEKIRRRWVEAGLGAAAQVARMSTRDLLAALFLPGFSTADRVTDVSGRGVGLDVVKRNIENVGGQVDVSTEPGRFSRFTIRIPLTMAIMQALLVRVGTETYAIPVSAVIQAEKITRDQIYSVENQKVITIRNAVIPLVELDEVFAYNYYLETEQGPEHRPRTPESVAENGSVYVVVLQGEGREIGVIVNSLVGSQDIVIKSLEDELVDARGVAGASILGDGTVTLILDVGEIQKMVLDGQHTDELRRSDLLRHFERYVRSQSPNGPGPTIH